MGCNKINRAVKWEVNESLLQSYRGVFIASQTLFISAVELTKENPLLNFVIIAIAIFQLCIGFTVVRARSKVVDFYKFNLSIYYPLSVYRDIDKEDVYVVNAKVRLKTNKNIPAESNQRQTRKKIDYWIPSSFLLIWVLSICMLNWPILVRLTLTILLFLVLWVLYSTKSFD